MSWVTVGCILGGSQQFGCEGVAQGRFLFVELLQFGLVGIGEVGAGMHKFLVVEVDQAQRFRIKPQRITFFVNGRDALKQFGVEIDCVRMRRQPGRFDSPALSAVRDSGWHR